ncbi:MAG: glyoxalase/bleomycin resistance/extradiol dioxygenase family protein [Bacteroidetes bacterium]|nr:MAG: glyoxalase/bleomycin resistance/extradiol dioxygenase family protein [Bacteroidota bacterium]REK06523.1 MAG: glyoxalase/bleomycin resistance/extradiol dioxygenase family protein [Bacteroidota bacterium]REK33289.1 MAG: glyoxalase/bleomycin resistance/extradiol dioxygenase family protein [Bacteroidota bacterium]REK49689.1 MAG: glyoxalase/bleomycin resistance/extradiol dioxygenase family protein [Bacteroidota bacterium]
MNIKSIYVNLPVKDLDKTRKFWNNLGFSFNEQFSDEKALCLVLNEGKMYSMLLKEEFFQTFTNRPLAGSSVTGVLIAIEVDTRERVDDVIGKAIKNGGSRYREKEDHGWMYYDCFADPDGHQWEVMFMDPAKIPQAQE